MVGAYSAASASGPPKDMTATPVNAHRPTGRAAPVARGRSALVPVMRVRNAVTSASYDQPPPADEAGALGAVPAPVVVIDVPAGATSHHLAPKLSVPWPLVCPAPESPA
jgi:hypothetical protein